MLSKKGGEKYLSIWWFVVLIIIGVGISIGVGINTFSEINVKNLEAEILSQKVISCIVYNGEINSSFINSDFDLYKNCNLNREKIAEDNFIEITVSKFDSCNIVNNLLVCNTNIKYKNYGDYSLKKNCEIVSGEIEARDFPSCAEHYVYSLNSSDGLVIHIITGSNRGKA